MTAFEKIHLDHLQSRVEHYAALGTIQSFNNKITGHSAIIENDHGAMWVQIKFTSGDHLIFKFEHYIGVKRTINDSAFKEQIRVAEIKFIEEMIAMVLDSLANKDDLSKSVINALLSKNKEHAV